MLCSDYADAYAYMPQDTFSHAAAHIWTSFIYLFIYLFTYSFCYRDFCLAILFHSDIMPLYMCSYVIRKFAKKKKKKNNNNNNKIKKK